jgi:hypothetical protein
MSAAEYQLKRVAIFAERVQGELVDLLDIAERWGADVRVPSQGEVTLTLFATGRLVTLTAHVGDWLLDKPGEGKGVCTDEEFQASFEAAE